jgi:hypothetical protein
MCFVFQMFHKMVQTQFKTKIKIVRSDNGGEYMLGDLGTYSREQGIIHQNTCVVLRSRMVLLNGKIGIFYR